MNAILYWNQVALDANKVSHTNGKEEEIGPTRSSRALAIVHLAMYDAFAGVTNTPASLPPYLAGLPSAPPMQRATRSAAVAGAAYATLSALFPSQRPSFDAALAAATVEGSGRAEGHDYGLKVAAAILADRESDPTAKDDGYHPSLAHGRHRPDPDNPQQGFHGPFYGKAKCFAVSTRHDLDCPPAPGTPAYRRYLRQVRGKGIAPELAATLPASSPARTSDETAMGVYWGYDGAKGLGTPPRLYNQIVRQVVEARGGTEEEHARLFALVNAAMADAGILAWAEKYEFDVWRPVVGIREADQEMTGPASTGGNPITSDCDTGWLPLGAPSTNSLTPDRRETNTQYPCQQVRLSRVKNFTPNFPAYPSGHATFGAAALHMVRLFYNVPVGDRSADALFKNGSDDMAFISDEYNGVSTDNLGTVRPRHARTFPNGLWQMIEENGLSRVYLGVHWAFDAFAIDSSLKPDYTKERIGGVGLGLRIAEDIWTAGNGEAPRKSVV